MSVTTLVWIVLYCGAALFSFVNPVFGAVGYLLEYYMRPELKWWGDELPALRYNLIISVVLGLSFLVTRSSQMKLARVPNPSLRWLIGLCTVMVLVNLSVAISAATSWSWSIQWMKMAIIFPLLVVGVVRTRSAFNLFVVANLLGAFWWGWESWVDPKRAEGRLQNVGSGDTLNDNAASAHLLTILPFALIYLLTEKDSRLRAVALLATPFIINTIILCNSRGSMVGLVCAASAAVFLIRSGYRFRLITATLGMALTLLLLADQQFINRQKTTTRYEEDGSAQQRLASWKGAYELVKDRPFGTGGRGFHMLSPVYIPDIVEAHGGDLRAPHNTYAMVASEWGVAGLICYLGIYGSAFALTRRITKRGAMGAHGFFYWRALAIQLGLIGYLVAGAFTDRLYGEAGYWLVALAYALYRLQRTEEAKEMGHQHDNEANSTRLDDVAHVA